MTNKQAIGSAFFAVMLLFAFNSTVFALTGSGDPNDPYLIEDLADFDEFAGNTAYWGSGVYTRLECDPNLSGSVYAQAPIPTFNGNFDGQNHTIFNLTVTGLGECALFGYVSGTSSESAIIKNIVLQQCNITSSAAYNGCLVGLALNYVTVENCHVKEGQIASSFALTGGLIGLADNTSGVTPDVVVSKCSVVNSNVSGSNYVGGLIGAGIKATVQNCYVNCSVQGTGEGVGGLVGVNYGTIQRSFFAGSVDGDSSVGGFAGENGSSSSILMCYSEGDVSSNGSAGGIVGSTGGAGLISHCYATGIISGTGGVGGIMGIEYNHANYESCYWDITKNPSLQDSGSRGEVAEIFAATTTAMKQQGTFTGWDFVGEDINGFKDHWRLCVDGVSSPKLAWESLAGDFECPDGVADEDLLFFADMWLMRDYEGLVLADIFADGIVDIEDVLVVCNNWLASSCGDCGGADVADDDVVDYKDFAVVSSRWGDYDFGRADLNVDGDVTLCDFVIFAGNWLDGF